MSMKKIISENEQILKNNASEEKHFVLSAKMDKCFLPLDKIQRPEQTMRRVYDALLPFASPVEVRSNRHVLKVPGERNCIWLVSNGNLSFYRSYDDLKIAISPGPVVAGLASLFSPFDRHVYRVSRGAKVASLTLAQAHTVINNLDLWKDVSELLGFVVQMMCYRDEHMVSKDSYSIIRAKLIEYLNKKERNALNQTGIASYILTTTHLSRSLVYNYLSSLTKGGYIKLDKGKLTEIIKLPEHY
ncbi:helix-turn-helix domain-containing protein [Citrobacter amalonaticus]|uniref:helix-turn-helix domain-containing protein n=1 Tax=Citrobacter amalonaticus TaxID=35703 RepID=UPI0019055F7B|nr:helix-turn-helix domain-containing protein [Citrobacter amalonaticus]MBJ9328038.1 helix-turn-helix domain-containing protein [Citrobacter amalonaticus]HCD1278894.1 helix-turn-helix domain-containing protein [Citrobacter amalonaticus]